MSTQSLSHIRIVCSSCGKKLKFAASAAGKKGKCPACATVFRVPQPKPAPEPVAAAPAGGMSSEGGGLETGDDLLSQLAGGESVQSDIVAPPPPPAAGVAPPPPPAGVGAFGGPAASAPMAGGGVLSHVAKSTGRLALGCILASIAALISAAGWTLIGIASKREFAVLAWVLGALVGFAMSLGNRKASRVAGLIAAGLSLVSIVVAKAFIFGFVLYAAITGNTSNTELRRAFVAYHMATETLESRGVVRDSPQWQQQWEDVYTAAFDEVSALDVDELEQRWQHYRDQDALALAKAKDSAADTAEASSAGAEPVAAPGGAPPDDPNAAEGAGGSLAGFFVSTMFGPMDIIFMLLALASAYRAGSRGRNAAA